MNRLTYSLEIASTYHARVGIPNDCKVPLTHFPHASHGTTLRPQVKGLLPGPQLLGCATLLAVPAPLLNILQYLGDVDLLSCTRPMLDHIPSAFESGFP